MELRLGGVKRWELERRVDSQIAMANKLNMEEAWLNPVKQSRVRRYPRLKVKWSQSPLEKRKRVRGRVMADKRCQSEGKERGEKKTTKLRRT